MSLSSIVWVKVLFSVDQEEVMMLWMFTEKQRISELEIIWAIFYQMAFALCSVWSSSAGTGGRMKQAGSPLPSLTRVSLSVLHAENTWNGMGKTRLWEFKSLEQRYTASPETRLTLELWFPDFPCRSLSIFLCSTWLNKSRLCILQSRWVKIMTLFWNISLEFMPLNCLLTKFSLLSLTKQLSFKIKKINRYNNIWSAAAFNVNVWLGTIYSAGFQNFWREVYAFKSILNVSCDVLGLLSFFLFT